MFGIDFPTQAGEMDIDDIVERGRAIRLAPYLTGQHLPGDHLPLVPYQATEEIEFPWCEINFFSISPGLPRSKIEGEISHLMSHRFIPRGSAMKRPHPGQKFREGEGLHQIIVRTRVQAPNPVFNLIAGCQ